MKLPLVESDDLVSMKDRFQVRGGCAKSDTASMPLSAKSDYYSYSLQDMQMKHSMKKHIKMCDHQTRILTAEMDVEASIELSFSSWLPSLSTQKTVPSTFFPALCRTTSR